MFLIPQIVLFGVTAYQDFKDRAISWYLPLLIVLTGFLAAVFNEAVFWKDYLASLCFVVLQLFGLFVYLAVKSKTVKIHLTRDFLGLGDILFFLAVIPFFAVFIYYQNFNNVIFVHATFLFLLIAMKELTKDLENIKGDLAQNYKTIPVVYGVVVSKKMLTALSIATFIPALLLLMYFSIGYMDYYFYASIVTLLFFDIFLWKSNKRSHFLTLHNILKCIIVAGVFSIVLINVHLVLSRVF